MFLGREEGGKLLASELAVEVSSDSDRIQFVAQQRASNSLRSNDQVARRVSEGAPRVNAPTVNRAIALDPEGISRSVACRANSSGAFSYTLKMERNFQFFMQQPATLDDKLALANRKSDYCGLSQLWDLLHCL
jgi:hypothetical protein